MSTNSAFAGEKGHGTKVEGKPSASSNDAVTMLRARLEALQQEKAYSYADWFGVDVVDSATISGPFADISGPLGAMWFPLTVASRHCDPSTRCLHTGLLILLADVLTALHFMAAFPATWTASIDLSVADPAPIPEGTRVVLRSRLLRTTAKVHFMSACIVDADQPDVVYAIVEHTMASIGGGGSSAGPKASLNANVVRLPPTTVDALAHVSPASIAVAPLVARVAALDSRMERWRSTAEFDPSTVRPTSAGAMSLASRAATVAFPFVVTRRVCNSRGTLHGGVAAALVVDMSVVHAVAAFGAATREAAAAVSAKCRTRALQLRYLRAGFEGKRAEVHTSLVLSNPRDANSRRSDCIVRAMIVSADDPRIVFVSASHLLSLDIDRGALRSAL